MIAYAIPNELCDEFIQMVYDILNENGGFTEFRYKDEDEDEKEYVNPPKSILERMEDGEDFDNILFGKNSRKTEDEKLKLIEESAQKMMNPFVFIANRLTFIIATKHPIIWDTSSISISADNAKMFVAIDEDKTFPKPNLKSIAKMTMNINNDAEIKSEIANEFFGSVVNGISCFPDEQIVNGKKRIGISFYIFTE